MKKVKKYYPGVNGLTTSNAGAVTDPNAFSTGKFLFPQQKTLGNIVDNKVMSQDYLDKAKPSFMDKAGSFMGKYGGDITQAANTLMPLLMKKTDPNAKPYKTGTNMINSKKSKLIKYQSGTNATDIIGPGPLDNLSEMSPEQLKKFNDYNGKKEIAEAINRVNRMGAPVNPLTPRMASFRAPEQTPMTPKLNRIPVKEQSRKERKAENRKLEGMAKAPITYNENSFVGPPQFVGPSDQELKLGRTREDAQSARNLYEAKQKGTPMTDALLKSTMSSQAFKDTLPAKKSLNIQYNENKGGYTRALKSGKVNAKGNLVDPNTGFEYEDLRKKSITSAKGNKPVTNTKTTPSTKGPFFKDGVAINKFKDPATGRSYFTNNRIFDEKTGRMGKYRHDEKTNKVITQWDKINPNTNSNRRVYPGESPLAKYKNLNNAKNNTQENKTIQKPTQTAAQIDSALNSINLPKFKNKNTLHPLGYSSKK